MFLIKVKSCNDCPQACSQAEGILCLQHWKRVSKKVKTFPKWCKAQKWEGNLTVDAAFAKREKELEEYAAIAKKAKLDSSVQTNGEKKA